MKILINTTPGGFELSTIVMRTMYRERVPGIHNISKVDKDDYWLNVFEFQRNDLTAISIVEHIGLMFSAGPLCNLKIVEIPDNVERWEVQTTEYGVERVLYGQYQWVE